MSGLLPTGIGSDAISQVEAQQLKRNSSSKLGARCKITLSAARISWAMTHPAISRGSQGCPEGCQAGGGGSGPAAVTAVMAPLKARARRSMGRCLLSCTNATCHRMLDLLSVTTNKTDELKLPVAAGSVLVLTRRKGQVSGRTVCLLSGRGSRNCLRVASWFMRSLKLQPAQGLEYKTTRVSAFQPGANTANCS